MKHGAHQTTNVRDTRCCGSLSGYHEFSGTGSRVLHPPRLNLLCLLFYDVTGSLPELGIIFQGSTTSRRTNFVSSPLSLSLPFVFCVSLYPRVRLTVVPRIKAKIAAGSNWFRGLSRMYAMYFFPPFFDRCTIDV